MLRGWPVREIERDVRLSSPQRGPRDARSAFTRVHSPSKTGVNALNDVLCVAGCPSRRVLRARHRFAQGRRHARRRLPRRERAHPGRPHGRDAQAPCRRAHRHRRDPARAHAFLRGARSGAEGEVCGDELGVRLSALDELSDPHSSVKKSSSSFFICSVSAVRTPTLWRIISAASCAPSISTILNG